MITNINKEKYLEIFKNDTMEGIMERLLEATDCGNVKWESTSSYLSFSAKFEDKLYMIHQDHKGNTEIYVMNDNYDYEDIDELKNTDILKKIYKKILQKYPEYKKQVEDCWSRIEEEEYKKKYEEALERCKKEFNFSNLAYSHEEIKQRLERVFPELKESEDERIRKQILDCFKTMKQQGCFPSKHKDQYDSWIAWLEKQGHDGKKWIYEDVYIKEKEQLFQDGIDEVLENPQKYGLEKQGEPTDKGEISDGYHTFNELYYYRMLYNAAFFNMLPKEWVHKSKKHHDGEECFGGGWFIVMANLPTGQISNHYEIKDWNLFQLPEKEVADKWDGHSPQEAAKRLHRYLLEKQGEQKPNFCHHEVDFSNCSEEYRKAYYDGWNNCNQQHAQLEAEQKPAWSEEDEKFLNLSLVNLTELKDRFGETYGKVGNCIDWLKSLKERYTWKPSNEQLDALHDAAVYVDKSIFPYPKGILMKLYKQLKKLREE